MIRTRKKLLTIVLILLFVTMIPATGYAKNKKNYTIKKVPSYCSSFKSYMDYSCLMGSRNTPQKKLQLKCKTDKKTGIRTYKGRYCIALGSGYCKKIGTKIDIIMKNGKTLKCILADGKADRHTDSSHRYDNRNKHVVEFVVSTSKMKKQARFRGDVSYTSKKFRGKIKKIKIYKS